ncbi:MAG: hypothetical protein FJW20_03170 [Acidimicrobiia bacterium]|nr:hypothetical protein [Acidimicrobiia bacterium]
MKSVWVATLAIASAGSLAARDLRKAVEVVTAETLTFSPGGTIRIDDSFGQLNVEGWERDEVELRVVRRTQWHYEPEDAWKAKQQLQRITVETTRWGQDLTILTRFPRPSLYLPFGGRSNLHMEYGIKVPRKATLRIRHSAGEVNVQGVDASIDIQNKVGEVSLRLPDREGYDISAETKIGDVDSSLEGRTKRTRVFGASFSGSPRGGGKNVTVRVKVGMIYLGKWREPVSGRR